MKKIERVYIAGLLAPRGHWSKNPAIDYITNCREMIRWGVKALLAGFDPFIPALDFLIFMLRRDGEVITEPMIKRYSKSWLEACDAVVLTPGWQKSAGTLAEIRYAEKQGIPVFKSLDRLVEYTKENDDETG